MVRRVGGQGKRETGAAVPGGESIGGAGRRASPAKRPHVRNDGRGASGTGGGGTPIAPVFTFDHRMLSAVMDAPFVQEAARWTLENLDDARPNLPDSKGPDLAVVVVKATMEDARKGARAAADATTLFDIPGPEGGPSLLVLGTEDRPFGVLAFVKPNNHPLDHLRGTIDASGEVWLVVTGGGLKQRKLEVECDRAVLVRRLAYRYAGGSGGPPRR